MMSPSPKILEIGPGINPLPEGTETLDVVGTPTYQERLGTSLRLPSLFWDEVYASHVLEHVEWYYLSVAFSEIHRILKPNGIFEVWVPDFEYIVNCYRERKVGDNWKRYNSDQDPMKWVNGRVFAYGPPHNWHKSLFDQQSLTEQLKTAGFTDITRIVQRKRGTGHGPMEMGFKATKPIVKHTTVHDSQPSSRK